MQNKRLWGDYKRYAMEIFVVDSFGNRMRDFEKRRFVVVSDYYFRIIRPVIGRVIL